MLTNQDVSILFLFFFPTGSIYTKWQEIKNTALMLYL